VAADVVGADNVFEFEPTMGAEDFAFFLEKMPGCYVVIGNGVGDHRAAGHGLGPCVLHGPHYDFNDEIIPIGGSFWVRLAERWFAEASEPAV
jgi:hippurate hydrolase